MHKTFASVIVSILFFTFQGRSQDYKNQLENCNKTYSSTNNELMRRDKIDQCLVGTVAPNFKAITTSNKEFSLTNYQGKSVILTFCHPTDEAFIERMPELNKLVKSYDGKVVFIALTNGNETMAKVLEKQSNLSVIKNSESIRTEVFQLPALYPYTIIIGAEEELRVCGLVIEELRKHLQAIIEGFSIVIQRPNNVVIFA